MNIIARKLPIFVLMAAAVATTALTIGATTTFAASNTHRHGIQLMGKDDSWARPLSSFPLGNRSSLLSIINDRRRNSSIYMR